jgi:hypothetical protein
LAGTGVQVRVGGIPADWYVPGTNGPAGDFLSRVISTARSEHGLAAVAC